MKNHFLFFQKAIASYFVVFIHCLFPGYLGTSFDALARFAVPLFFMISGFFSFEKNYNKIKNNIFKIIKLTVISWILYFIWFLLIEAPDFTKIKLAMLSWFSIKSILKLLILNVPFPEISGHLWYLLALIYCYLIFIFINKFCLFKYVYMCIPFLLIIHLILGEFLSYFGVSTPITFVRNFALMGFPFFMLGNLVGKNKEYFKTINLSEGLICVIIISGIILTLAERYFGTKNELFVGSIITASFLLVYAIKFPFKFEKSKFEYIGYKYSLFIYLFHPMFITISKKACEILYIVDSNIIKYLLPIFVCILTTIAATLFYITYYQMQKLIKRCRSK